MSASASPSPGARRVALVTLGCARNEVDSEELAARLAGAGWQVGTDGTDADVVVVNTCGFVEHAKQESIDTLLAAAGTGARVVAAGCLAQRYGRELAASLPEADAVLGFDDYPQISERLTAVLSGSRPESHRPHDRRRLLPLAPVQRAGDERAIPGHAAQPVVDAATPAHLRGVLRHRLTAGPVAPLKLASGCDRRCSFCAIPSFRGAFVSRPPEQLLAEAAWLAGTGVRELVLVSENSTSYGKDLGQPRLLQALLPQLAAVPGIARVRVSYLQPAEVWPGLIDVIAGTAGVASYFDLSFQHASADVLRRMRRFGSTANFLELLAAVRARDPDAGIRSNVIVGFPGERAADLRELESFLHQAELDAIGVFDYSDEEGTEAATLTGKVRRATVKRRYDRVCALADEVCAQRASRRVGTDVEVLVDQVSPAVEGRAAHQAPEVDGCTVLVAAPGDSRRHRFPDDPVSLAGLRRGDLVRATVIASQGADLTAVATEMIAATPLGRR